MPDNIDTRISPALHPANVQNIDGYCEDTSYFLQSTEAAFAEAYTGIARVHEARAAAGRNPSWTPAEALIQTQDFADKVFSKVAKSFDGALASLNRSIASLEADLTAPVEARASHVISTEVRAHVKAMPTEQRMDFVLTAIKGGDDRTVQSLLGAPAYLSGLTTEMQQTLTRMYHEHSSPEKSKRLNAMKGAADLIRERSGLLFGELEKAVGEKPHVVAALRAQKAEAEKAFRFSL